MSSTKADRKAADDAASWLFNVVTSVGIILVNKALMATYGFSFGMLLVTIYPKYFVIVWLLLYQIDCIFCSLSQVLRTRLAGLGLGLGHAFFRMHNIIFLLVSKKVEWTHACINCAGIGSQASLYHFCWLLLNNCIRIYTGFRCFITYFKWVLL